MKKNLPIIIFLLFCEKSFSQNNLKEWNGPFESLVEGTANYQYYTKGDERIYHGNFYFTGTDNHEILNFLFTSGFKTKYNISGSYNNNLKNGKWNFTVFVPKGKVSFLWMEEEFEGTTENIGGVYKDGDKTGQWNFTRKGNKSGNIIESSIVNFNKNMLVKNFSYRIPKEYKIDGRFNDEGKLDGKWTIKYYSGTIPFLDEREYKNGVLFYRKNKNESTGEILIKYDSSKFVTDFFNTFNQESGIAMINGIPYKLAQRELIDSEDKITSPIKYWTNESSDNRVFKVPHGSNPSIAVTESFILIDEEKYRIIEEQLRIQKEKEDARLQNEQERENKYLLSLSKGGELYLSKEYEQAIASFKDALEIHQNSEAQSKITESENLLKIESRLLSDAEKMTEKKNFEGAITKLKKVIMIRNNQFNQTKLTETQKVYDDYKTLMVFLKERNSTIYNYKDFDNEYIETIKLEIQDRAKDRLSNETKDFNSNLTFQYSIDTTDKALSAFKIQTTNNEILSNEIGNFGKIRSLHPIYKNGYSLNSKAEFNLDFYSKTETFKAKKRLDGKLIIKGNPTTVQENEITKLIANKGIYKTKVSYLKINEKEYYYSKLIGYKNIGGPSNAFLSILVPGLGDKFVATNHNGLSIALITYGLIGAGIGSKFYSISEYDNYHKATSQSNMDTHYNNANISNYAFYGLIATGSAIWLYDIFNVAGKGFKNRKEGKNYKKQIGLSYNPNINSLNISCSINY